MTVSPIQHDVLSLTQELIKIKSVSQWSNVAISDYLSNLLEDAEFEVERITYVDENEQTKVSLVARKGQGQGGLGLLSHSDTVPGQEVDWPAFEPKIRDGKLFGRGSCDMKGPIAAAYLAAASVQAKDLQKPLTVVITADEEYSGLGAKTVVEESNFLKENPPDYGIITEPTQLVPVYAHKGIAMIKVTAQGEAAHTSTDAGTFRLIFLIAPFLHEMADLAKTLKSDPSFMNQEFSPPTLGFNMTLNDGDCKPNVTAAKTVCMLNFRPMPNDRSQDVLEIISQKAQAYGFEIEAQVT